MTRFFKQVASDSPVLPLRYAAQADTDDRTDLESLLSHHEQALNAGAASATLLFYEVNGVLMARPNRPSAGQKAVAKACGSFCRTTDLDIDCAADEIVTFGGVWAFARTRSEGRVVLQQNGVSTPGANQDLFILRKQDGAWKTASYIFSPTMPLQ